MRVELAEQPFEEGFSARGIRRLLWPRGFARSGARWRRDRNFAIDRIDRSLPVGAPLFLRSRLRQADSRRNEEFRLRGTQRAAWRRLPVAVNATLAAARAVVRVVDDAVDHRGEMFRHADHETTRRKLIRTEMYLAA